MKYCLQQTSWKYPADVNNISIEFYVIFYVYGYLKTKAVIKLKNTIKKDLPLFAKLP
jgi:hypothetical protein